MNFNDANLFLNLFWLIPLILIVLYYGRVARNKKLSRFIKTAELKHQLTLNASQTKRRLRDVFFFLGVFFLVIAAAGPHWGTKLVKRPGQSRDLLVVLDTSRSMLADDISPSRLMHAKWFIRNLLDQTPGDRYGLIAFAGTAFLECPLTQDRNGFLLFLDDINTDTIPVGGTNVEKALTTALDAFKAAEGSHRAVIFITDGDELQGDSSKIIDEFKEKNIPIFVVGIGDPNLGSFIQIEGNKFVLDKNGDRVKSKLNESSLQRIAAKVGGTYVHSTVVHDGLSHIVDKVRNLVPEQHEDNTVSRPIERYQIPLFIGFICFAIRLLIGERKQMTKPVASTLEKFSANTASTVIFMAIFIVPSTVYYSDAQDDEESDESTFLNSPVLLPPSQDNSSQNVLPPPDQIRQQMSRVSSEKDKMIHDSIESLLTRLENASDPLEKAYLHYNLGVNYQLSGRHTQAETEYNHALDLGNDSKELKSVVYQNLGVLKHQDTRDNIAVDPDAAMESLAQAQGYYREAMRNNPNLRDIAVNQELVLKDRKLIEEIKKMQQQMSDLQNDAQESAQEALDAQQAANQETNQASKEQKQSEAKEKTENARQATEKLEQAARQTGQENAAEYVKQAKEKLDNAGDEQSKSMQQQGKEKEREESSEKAEELISEALNQLGVKQEEHDEDSDGEKAQTAQKGEEEEKESDDENEETDQTSQDQQVVDQKSDSGNEGESDLRNLDQIQALSILNAMQEQERDLKQDLKEVEKQKMGVKDVKQNW